MVSRSFDQQKRYAAFDGNYDDAWNENMEDILASAIRAPTKISNTFANE